MLLRLADIPISNGTYSLRGLHDVVIDGDMQTLTQKREKRATVEIIDCQRVTWRNWRMIGLGTETPWGQNSANGASALRILDSRDVRIEACDITNHTGGGIRFRGNCPGLHIIRNKITGMGPQFIHAGDNGSDAAIGHAGGTATHDDLLLWGNDISGHAFGVFLCTGRGVRVLGNSIHDIHGQHGVYGQPGGGVEISQNVLRNIAYCGIKLQISGAAATDVEDVIQIASNSVDGCGQAALLVGSVGGVNKYFRHVQIADNHLNHAAHAIYLRRVTNCDVHGNRLSALSSTPIYKDDVTGEFANNSIYPSERIATP